MDEPRIYWDPIHAVLGPPKRVMSSISMVWKLAIVVGLFLMVVVWLRDNLPTKVDVAWIKAGGPVAKGHPPAGKFNAAQKALYFFTMGGGLLVVFARAPRLGQVKRRLAREAGDLAALRFHRAMLRALARRP